MANRPVSRVRLAALLLMLVGIALAIAPARAVAQFNYSQAEGPAEALARHVRVLAGDPRNFQALIGAGKAALALGDSQAAAGFFGRADEVWPASPMPKVGMGAALTHEGNAAGALQYFAQAAQLGATAATYALERGLAFDLLGRHAEAQADYRAAMQTPDADEARRRLALSLAISGNKAEALSLLGPLVARGDAAGGRVRALVLAVTGDSVGARAAIEAAMPGSSYQMDPFFRRLPTLRSDQKAAAVHLGIFPESGQQQASATLPTQGDRLRSIEELLTSSNPPPAAGVSVPPAPPVAQPAPPPRSTPTQVASAATKQAIPPKRYWVQLASGPNAAALPEQFNRLKRRHRDLLYDLSGYVADEGQRSRLLIGPFRNGAEAAEFADGLESSGLRAFSWSSQQGQTIRKLPAE